MTTQLTGSIEAIMQSICNQLISFQQQIADREENKGIPTAQEINMQCRLINCIDKLRRHHAGLVKAARAMDVAREEGSVAAIINTPAAQDDTDSGFIHLTEEDFRDHKHLMGSFRHVDDNASVRFKGEYVTVKWLEYNLYQYCLPPAERRFMLNARQIAREIDYNDLQQKIREYNGRQESIAA